MYIKNFNTKCIIFEPNLQQIKVLKKNLSFYLAATAGLAPSSTQNLFKIPKNIDL